MILIGRFAYLIDKTTAVVLVTRESSHPLYKKIVKKTKKYLCHVPNDSNELLIENQVVKIKPCRPISKKKKFALIPSVSI